jgi:hypothetical protein
MIQFSTQSNLGNGCHEQRHYLGAVPMMGGTRKVKNAQTLPTAAIQNIQGAATAPLSGDNSTLLEKIAEAENPQPLKKCRDSAVNQNTIG